MYNSHLSRLNCMFMQHARIELYYMKQYNPYKSFRMLPNSYSISYESVVNGVSSLVVLVFLDDKASIREYSRKDISLSSRTSAMSTVYRRGLRCIVSTFRAFSRVDTWLWRYAIARRNRTNEEATEKAKPTSREDAALTSNASYDATNGTHYYTWSLMGRRPLRKETFLSTFYTRCRISFFEMIVR